MPVASIGSSASTWRSVDDGGAHVNQLSTMAAGFARRELSDSPLSGAPVEFFLTPGHFSDVLALDLFEFDLPPGSTIYGDKAYNWYLLEDLLAKLSNGCCLNTSMRSHLKASSPKWCSSSWLPASISFPFEGGNLG